MITGEIHNQSSRDPFKEPIYYSSEVARFVKITPTRVARWLKGYEYIYSAQRVSKPPVIKQKDKTYVYEGYASFYDLIELLFIKNFLAYGISLQKLRKAFDEAKEILEVSHLAHQVFFTDGKYICLFILTEDVLLELLSGGQLAIKNIIEELAHQIDFDKVTKLACRWYPPEGNNIVVLDPLVSFGKPVIRNKGITTENVYDLYIAEGEKAKPVCSWFDLTQEELRAAINFQTQLVA